MKGLLLKEWYQTIKYCRSILLISALFMMISFITPQNILFLFYPAFMIGMIPMTLHSYDERSHWTSYVCTMPYTRAQVVSAKYIVALIAVGAVWLISSVVIFTAPYYSGATGASRFALSGLVLLVGLLMPTMSLPGTYKFGVEKWRMINIVAIIVVCAVGAGLGSLLGISALTLPAFSGETIALIEFAVILVLFPLSWLLSIRFYKQKEL